MAQKLNWGRASIEAKMRTQGTQLHEDLPPRGPEDPRNLPNRSGISLQPSRLPANRKRPNEIKNKGKIDLLNFVAKSVARGVWVADKVPKTVTKELSLQVERTGGLVKWAEAQPKFNSLLKRYKNKSYNDLLFYVAKSVSKGAWISNRPPKSVSKELLLEAKKSGGLVLWAKTQPKYKSLIEEQKKEKQRP